MPGIGIVVKIEQWASSARHSFVGDAGVKGRCKSFEKEERMSRTNLQTKTPLINESKKRQLEKSDNFFWD